MTFARIDAESSILRWFMTRHGEAVMTQFPHLLTRLAQGPAAVALVFSGDRAVGLVAWRQTGPAVAELLAAHATGADGIGQAELSAFVHGPDGPARPLRLVDGR